jgi:hypothetical protein
MARHISTGDISPILAAAERWIQRCLVEDRSVFVEDSWWTPAFCDEVYQAFVGHPDYGHDDFMTKLKGQMKHGSAPAQQLMAEMLWALLLFPSKIKPSTKRQQVREIWAMSGHRLSEDQPLLDDKVLIGVGSGGPGFNTYRPDELEFLISLVRDLKRRDQSERRHILTDYDAFMGWIDSVPRKGTRQFRHMLRYFAFPDRVERISTNNDRRLILEGLGMGSERDIANWNDRQLDDKLMELRTRLQTAQPTAILDFYEPPLSERWSRDRKIKTDGGEVTVTVPSDDDDVGAKEPKTPQARQSIQIQSKLARIGAVMGFKVWIPKADRRLIRDLVNEQEQAAFLDDLPLNYDSTTIETIELIDVLWLRHRSIVRAFEVEHTTAVYSGLLRMADLLALQPNMDIRLHIVAPDERRDKVFREMKRPVFSLLDRGPLSDSCTFISYESIDAINSLGHLAYTSDGIIGEYEEKAE